MENLNSDYLINLLSEKLKDIDEGDIRFQRLAHIILAQEIYQIQTNSNQPLPNFRMEDGHILAGDVLLVIELSSISWERRINSSLRGSQAHSFVSNHKTVKRVCAASINKSNDRGSEFVNYIRRIGELLDKRVKFEWWDQNFLFQKVFDNPALARVTGFSFLTEEEKASFDDLRSNYRRILENKNNHISFVGISVYKEETAKSIPMDKIYIPLDVIPEDENEDASRFNPLNLSLHRGKRYVILGDPGSGKSSMLRFLSLVGSVQKLRERYNSVQDDRLFLLISLRDYDTFFRGNHYKNFVNYIIDFITSSFNLTVSRNFLEYFLFNGDVVLLVDGVDELPDLNYRKNIRELIREFSMLYPGNTILVTSRFVGYEKEARFDGNDFKHVKIAGLTDKQIDNFIHDWYTIRVEDENDCKEHISDLIRIVHNPDASSIRVLSENPLLLAIICLVHRIEAKLPDERVVLYQRCVETILNTWHTWKYRQRRENNNRRGETESINRARLEAIAYWMQLLKGAGAPGRATVSKGELIGFLSEHIVSIEENNKSDSFEIAKEFLRFVKERAGLLVEVTVDRYSFVHLTFQEYLASEHLLTLSEFGGVDELWKFIEDKCEIPHWHETLRLLVSSLKNPASKKAILGWILEMDAKDPQQSVNRILLAGGALLDGIQAAESLKKEIIIPMLHYVLTTKTDDDIAIRKISSQLSVWIRKSEENGELLLGYAAEVNNHLKGDPDARLRLVLMLTAWGVEGKSIVNFFGCGEQDPEENIRLFALTVGGCDSVVTRASSGLDSLHSLCSTMASSDSNQNLLSTIILCMLIKSEAIRARSVFFHLLFLVPNIALFIDTMTNFILLGRKKPLPQYVTSLINRWEQDRAIVSNALKNPNVIQEKEGYLYRQVDKLTRVSDSVSKAMGLKPFPESGRHARNRVLSSLSTYGSVDQIKIETEKRKFRTLLQKKMPYPQKDGFSSQSSGLVSQLAIPSKGIGESKILMEFLTDAICHHMNLEPKTLWMDALKATNSPSSFEKKFEWADMGADNASIMSVYRENATNDGCWTAANQIFIDLWLNLLKNDSDNEPSPYETLIGATRDVEHLPLQIAHCIRDIARRDASREDKLKDMLNSNGLELTTYFKKQLR
ncbi:MAG: signal transduction protein [Magnetococcales bacterium]|nr:signal transduction protein [Magnetococcales bacterium]